MMNLKVFKGQSWLQNRWISRVLWFLSSSRNASVLIFSCLAAYLLEINGLNQLTLSGIPRKMPFFLLLLNFFLSFLFLLEQQHKKKRLERAELLSLKFRTYYFMSFVHNSLVSSFFFIFSFVAHFALLYS